MSHMFPTHERYDAHLYNLESRLLSPHPRGTHHTHEDMAADTTDAAAYLSTTSGDHDHTARTTCSETPRNRQTFKSEPGEPTMTLKSGGIFQEKWIIAQAKQRRDKNKVGDNIRLQSGSPSPDARFNPLLDVYEAASADLLPDEPPNPMSDVFNIAELLERILLNLKTSFLIKKAMLVCRGFKQSLDGSPAFKKRSSFAFRINYDFDDVAAAKGVPCFYVNLRPKWMPRLYHTPTKSTVEFSFQESTSWFRMLAQTEDLRRLRVFEKMPALVMVHWKDKDGRGNVGLMGLQEGHEFTFGHFFDALATNMPPIREAIESVGITW